MSVYALPPVKSLILKKEKEPMSITVMELALKLGILSSIQFDVLVKVRNGESIDHYIKNNPETLDELVCKELLIKTQ